MKGNLFSNKNLNKNEVNNLIFKSNQANYDVPFNISYDDNLFYDDNNCTNAYNNNNFHNETTDDYYNKIEKRLLLDNFNNNDIEHDCYNLNMNDSSEAVN